jgi:DNA replication protein DnaC
LEEFSFEANRAINPAVIGQLASGKSHLLIALGTVAAEAGYRVRHTLANSVVNEHVEAADESS